VSWRRRYRGLSSSGGPSTVLDIISASHCQPLKALQFWCLPGAMLLFLGAGCLRTGVVACSFRHDSPGGARHRVGQSHGRKREWSRGQHHPGAVGARWIASYPTSSGRGRHGHQAPARCTNAGRPASRFVPAGACRRSLSVLARDRGKRRELPPTGEPPGIGQAGAEASGNQQPDAGDGRQSDAGSITPVGSKDPPCQACRPRNRG